MMSATNDEFASDSRAARYAAHDALKKRLDTATSISNSKLAKRSKRIRALYLKGEKFHYRKKCGLGIAFMWDPVSAGRVKKRKMEKIAEITTYHSWDYYGFFKPAIAEVLAQIPKEYLKRVNAFCIIDYPKDAEDINRHIDVLNAGYHVATTGLYWIKE